MNENKKKVNLFLVIYIILNMFIFRFASKSDFGNILNVILILTDSILIGILLLKNKDEEDKKLYSIVYLSYILHVIFLFLDRLGYVKVFTGLDSEGFYRAASNNLSTTVNYVKFLQVFMKIFGTSRLVAQYFNLLCSFFSILTLIQIFNLLNINDKRKRFAITIFAFAPAHVMLSVALLRESAMIFLNVMSLYLFMKWYKSGKLSNFLWSMVLIFLSSWLHSGMIGALLAYFIAFTLYNRKENKIVLQKRSFFLLIFICVLILIVFSLFGNSVLLYFNRVDSVESISTKLAVGNTDYLTFLNNTTSLPLTIASLPLRIVYFYFSPMIWDCRNFSLLLVFLFSSSIYLVLSWKIFSSKSTNKTLRKLLLIMLLAISIVYGLGVSNTGTAMRHREKILPYFIILYGLAEEKKKKSKSL